MSTTGSSYLLTVPMIAGVISSSGARAPMYDVWKSICCRKMQRVPTGRLFGLLLWRKKKEICVECGVVVFVDTPTLNMMSNDNGSVLKGTH